MRLQHSSAARRLARRVAVVATLVAFAGGSVAVGRSAASDSNLTSDEVAAEILRVQDQADATAQRMADAEQRSGELAAKIDAAQAALAATSAQFDEIQSSLTKIAIDRFTGGPGSSMMILLDGTSDALQMNVLRDVALDTGATDLDTVDAVRTDLANEQADLASLQAQNAQVMDELATTQTQIGTQLAQLAKLRDRLKDAEVARAYAAKLEQRRQAAAAADAQRAAALLAEQQASAPPASTARGGGSSPSQATTPPEAPAPTVTTPPAGTAPRNTTPRSTTPDAPSPTSPPDASTGDTSPPDAAPTETAPPAPPPPAPVLTGGDWLCPVAGPNAFVDTFGAPRSGGRHHEGVDMMSPFGTPIVAVVAGNVTMKVNTLGGNTVSLNGVDGNRYYYAHMSSWEGGARSVQAGDVIGYVGHTGDTVANHLHFEIHPGGGPAVDPTATVRAHC